MLTKIKQFINYLATITEITYVVFDAVDCRRFDRKNMYERRNMKIN